MEENRRILIVDDNQAIHEDFKKVLVHENQDSNSKLRNLEDQLFGEPKSLSSSGHVAEQPTFALDSAFQGQEALQMVEKANAEGKPYAVVFMDVRMPPGWDGIETIRRIWDKFPYTEMVICTAYSDYSPDDIADKLGMTDRLLFLRKPF